MIACYVSGPYTIGDQEVHVRNHMLMGNKLIDLGYCPLLPLLSHFLNLLQKHDYETYMSIDLEMLKRADILLRMPGLSNGADREVAYAKEHNIPVVYSIKELLDYKF